MSGGASILSAEMHQFSTAKRVSSCLWNGIRHCAPVPAGKGARILLCISLIGVSSTMLAFHKSFVMQPQSNTSAFLEKTETIIPCPTVERPRVLKIISLPLGPVPENAIHFVLSDGSSRVKLREICSIESAAIHHPGKPVVVNLMSTKIQWTEVLDHLNNTHPNVQFVQLDLRERLSGTPMGDGWVDKGLLEVKPEFKKNYISDIVRMATVYKYGGAYLDADMLVMRSFDEFRNAIPKEKDAVYANGNFMVFDKGHPFLYDVLQYLTSNFSTGGYAHNGPPAVTWVMESESWCNVTAAEKRTLDHCGGGIQLLSAEFFNPIDYKVVNGLLMANRTMDSPDVKRDIQQAYAVHLYNSQSQQACMFLNQSSFQPISSLVKKGCPGLIENIKLGYFR